MPQQRSIRIEALNQGRRTYRHNYNEQYMFVDGNLDLNKTQVSNTMGIKFITKEAGRAGVRPRDERPNHGGMYFAMVTQCDQ